MQNFYIIANESEYGPYSWVDLLELNRQGTVQDNTPCRNEIMTDYLPFRLVRKAVERKQRKKGRGWTYLGAAAFLVLAGGGTYYWQRDADIRRYMALFENKAQSDKENADKYRKFVGMLRQIKEGKKVDSFFMDGGVPLTITAASWGADGLVIDLLDRGASLKASDHLKRDVLRTSARKGLIKAVREIVSRGGDVNSRDEWGRTPLMGAVWMEHKEVVEFLLQNGADINALDHSGRSALSWAAEKGNGEMVKFLLSKGSQMEDKDVWTPNSPVRVAAKYGKMEVLEILLEKVKNKDMLENVLLYAVKEGERNMVRLVLKNGGKCIPRIWGCVLDSDDREMTRQFIEHGAKLDSLEPFSRQTPLDYAAFKGKAGCMDELFAKGTKPTKLTLEAAIEGGNVRAATLVVSKGIRPDFKITGKRALIFRAIARNRTGEIAEFLLTLGADLETRTEDGETPLMMALYDGKADSVRRLLARGASPVAKDKNGMTALMVAAYQGHKEAFKMLLDRYPGGVSVNIRDNKGRTALRWAAKGGNLPIVEMLLARGGLCHIVDSEGETPLMSAARAGNVNMAQAMLKTGKARVTAQGFDGRTALIWAMKGNRYGNSQLAMVRLLVDNGAEVNAKAKNGETAFSLAMEKKKNDVVSYLLDKGANAGGTDIGNMSLMEAVRQNNLLVVKLLLRKGADTNMAEDSGDTPLIAAAWGGYKEIVEELIKYNANIDAVKHSDGATALSAARDMNRREIVKILEGKSNIGKLGNWVPDSLSSPTVEWNLHPVLKGSGSYKISFFYTHGSHALSIDSVAVLVNGTEVDGDIHKGHSGRELKDNTYTLTIPDVSPVDKIILKAVVRGVDGTDSHGTVYVQKI